jgi:hypothetical protein
LTEKWKRKVKERNLAVTLTKRALCLVDGFSNKISGRKDQIENTFFAYAFPFEDVSIVCE